MKRVLVIPNWGQMTETVDGMPAEDVLKKYSPGNLLASFKGKVMYNTKRGELEINLPLEVQDKLMSNKVDTNITVLILEKGGKNEEAV